MGFSEGRPWLPPVVVVAIGAVLFLFGAIDFFKIWDIVPPLIWNILVLLVGVFLILLVLIQRGKGGGLAGAFGGVGGSSPFGSRAGDMFTYVTITVAATWVFLIMFQTISIQNSAAEAKRLANQGAGIGTVGGGGSQ